MSPPRHRPRSPRCTARSGRQRADVDSRCELVAGVDRGLDVLDEKASAVAVGLDRRVDELSGRLAKVLRRFGDR